MVDYKPTKADEILFLELLRNRGDKTVRDVINEQSDIPYKRCWYILSKWTGKGIYSYGVSLDLGWLEEEIQTRFAR